jgi:site-specific DNA recombinase
LGEYIGYCRVSTDRQRENTSLEEQSRLIEEFCKRNNHKLVCTIKEVGSGAKMSVRKDFQEAVKKIKSVNGIIACKLDRIARNTRDLLNFVEEILVPQEKSLILLDLNIDTATPIGKLMLIVMAAMASLERDLIIERTQGGRKAKARRGGYAYGAPGYGYRGKNLNKELKSVIEEQKIIKQVKLLRMEGFSLRAIAKLLNDNDTPTKQGKKWQAQTIKNVLRGRKPIIKEE